MGLAPPDQLRLSLLGLAAAATVAAVWLFVPACPAAAAPSGPAAAAPRDARGGVPVLVELFTSEGCSSCPPAEDVLARLDREGEGKRDGAVVVPLAHHVDYWDQLGWPDPLASAEATARQRAYAPLRSGSYTPQAVVDGAADVVGSREHALEQAIADAAKRPHLRVDLTVQSQRDGAYGVSVRTEAKPDASKDADVVLAVVQDRARVAVPRGENAERTLEHVAVVRRLVVLQPRGDVATTMIRPPKAVGAEGSPTFSVVAFVQERASRRVLGSARAPLVSP